MKVSQGFTEHGGGLGHAPGRGDRTNVERWPGRGVGADRPGPRPGPGRGPAPVRRAGPRRRTGRTSSPAASHRAYLPVGMGVNVVSTGGSLTLKPEYGGGALGRTFTTFSTSGFTAAQVLANAGKLDLALSADAFGEKQSLVTETQRRSADRRRAAGGGDPRGLLRLPVSSTTVAGRPFRRATRPSTMPASSPYNPFEQSVYVSRSVPWDGVVRNRSFTQKLGAGLIARLPNGWMAEGDLNWSRSEVRVANDARGRQRQRRGLGRGRRQAGGAGPVAVRPREDLFLATYRSYYQLAGGSLPDAQRHAGGRQPAGLGAAVAPAGRSADHDAVGRGLARAGAGRPGAPASTATRPRRRRCGAIG